MAADGPLAQLFVRHLAASACADAQRMPDLEERLEAMIAAAREAWPALGLSDELFMPFVAERAPVNVPIEQALGSLHVEDLYLACACASGADSAVEAFEATHRRTIDMALASMGEIHGVGDEVRQRLREKLLVATGASRPRIASYSGRGDLRSWVRATAIRETISVLRKARKELPVAEPMLAALPSPEDDPELLHLKGIYRKAFKEAFERALRGLSSRDRSLLQFKFVDGASIDDIARVYRVHRATAARWLAQIRERLLDDTRTHMMRHLEVQPRELDSIMRVIGTGLDASISGFLRR